MVMQKASILLVGMLSVAQSPAIAAESINPMTAAATSDVSTRALTIPQNDVDDHVYHVPIVLNDSVETYIEYFSTLRKDVFQSWLDNSAAYLDTMKAIFRDANLPEELVYVAMIESGFNPGAVSRAKAEHASSTASFRSQAVFSEIPLMPAILSTTSLTTARYFG